MSTHWIFYLGGKFYFVGGDSNPVHYSKIEVAMMASVTSKL
jgi:hypothetical protein